MNLLCQQHHPGLWSRGRLMLRCQVHPAQPMIRLTAKTSTRLSANTVSFLSSLLFKFLILLLAVDVRTHRPSTRLSTVSDRAFPPGREPVCGTLCWLKSPPRRRSRRSRDGKRRYCLHGVTLTVPDVSDIFVCCPLHCSHVLVLSVFLFCCCKVSQHSSH